MPPKRSTTCPLTSLVGLLEDDIKMGILHEIQPNPAPQLMNNGGPLDDLLKPEPARHQSFADNDFGQRLDLPVMEVAVNQNQIMDPYFTNVL